jgi:hypothetical protein
VKDLLVSEWVNKVKPDVNIVEVKPHPSHKRHSVDGVLVGAGSLCAITKVQNIILRSRPMLHTHTKTMPT